MAYLTYYLVLLFLSYALRNPLLMVGILLLVLLRPVLPDPVVLWRTFGRIRALETQIAANPSNVTARRELARSLLLRLRPSRALTVVEEALERAPDDAELLFLLGVARLRLGDAAGALDPLVRAVEIDPRFRFGEPYLVAGDALTKLGRYAEAEDAYERYLRANSSSIEGFTKLARARGCLGDAERARAALDEGLRTFWQLPGFKRRQEIGWWLRAHAARLRL